MRAKLGNQRAIDCVAIRLGRDGECLDETVGKYLLSLEFVARHVIGNGEDTVPMAFIDVALHLLNRTFLELDGDNSIGCLFKQCTNVEAQERPFKLQVQAGNYYLKRFHQSQSARLNFLISI
jgi:hypothetical protein